MSIVLSWKQNCNLCIYLHQVIEHFLSTGNFCTKPIEQLISRVKLLKLSMIPDNRMEYSILSSICRIFKHAAPVKPFWLITHKAVTSLKFGEPPQFCLIFYYYV